MGKRLWVERNKDGSWDAFSDDGAHIKFGTTMLVNRRRHQAFMTNRKI